MKVKLFPKSMTVPYLTLPGEEDYESPKTLAYSYTDEDYEDCDNPLRIHVKPEHPTKTTLRVKSPAWAVIILQRGSHFEYLKSGDPIEVEVDPPRTTLYLYVLSKSPRVNSSEIELEIGGIKERIPLTICK